MTGPQLTPGSFDKNFVLEETLDHALRHVDNSNILIGPGLGEIPGLVKLARRVAETGRTVEPGAAFRAAARARLIASMRATAATPTPRPRRAGGLPLVVSSWFFRAAAALSAVGLAGAATASASASALPGDPLYALKQTGEQIALHTATDDDTRQQVWLGQAETRLEETSQLLSQGRDADAGQTALRYSAALDEAASVGGAKQLTEPTTLQADHARIAGLLAAAPPPARAGLQRALQATERGPARTMLAAQDARQAPVAEPEPAVIQRTVDPTPAAAATPVTLARTPAADARPHGNVRTPQAQEAPPEVSTEASAEDAAEAARSDQTGAAHSAAAQAEGPPAAVEDRHPAGAAPKPADPPDHPGPPASRVDKPASPHVDQVPQRHGRP